MACCQTNLLPSHMKAVFTLRNIHVAGFLHNKTQFTLKTMAVGDLSFGSQFSKISVFELSKGMFSVLLLSLQQPLAPVSLGQCLNFGSKRSNGKNCKVSTRVINE